PGGRRGARPERGPGHRAAAAPDAVQPGIPDAVPDRLRQVPDRHRTPDVAFREDRERLSGARAGEDAPQEQRRADALRDQESARSIEILRNRKDPASAAGSTG